MKKSWKTTPLAVVLGLGLVFKMCFQNKFLSVAHDYLTAVTSMHYLYALFCCSFPYVLELGMVHRRFQQHSRGKETRGLNDYYG